MIIYWTFLVLVLWTVPSTSLICYTCNIPSFNISAGECGEVITVAEGAHCTIIEDFDPSNQYFALSSTFLNSSYIRVKEPYYITVEESIFYDETNSTWKTKTKRVIHGCDWDFCNRYALVAYLPDTFRLTIDSVWLDENIYGNGSVTGCHNCSNAICGNGTQSIDDNLCPFSSCENSTTCSLRDLWNDVETDEVCYQSECTPSQSVDQDDEKYKVQVEAIVYLAQNRSNFEIWQLDINCAADNCSRPTIFQEIKEQLQGEISNLTAFPPDRFPTTTPPPTTTTTLPANPIYCYACSCTGTTCPCTITEASSADSAYCYISRANVGQDIYIDYGHVYFNSTYFYVRDYPYVSITESITYNEVSGRWDIQPEWIIYGCNWNLCNKPELVPYLPSSFQMRLSESWLNSSVLGTGQPVRDCHECSNGSVCTDNDFIDGDQCPIQSCNTTCLVADRFDDPAHTDQCYDSYCAPVDSAGFVIETHRVDIEGILYASSPDSVELWEIDIYCRADNCSRPEIFQEIRENLTLFTGDLTVIFNKTAEVPRIRCFDCYCIAEANCTCDTVFTLNAASTYCTIVRNYNGSDAYIYFGYIEIAPSYLNVRELPFVLSRESILYNNATGQWFTRTNDILYGCNWDYCNQLSLLPLLPSGLNMTLPASWLNSSILGTGQAPTNCHTCGNNTICSVNATIDSSVCPTESCNTTCFASNTYVNSTTSEQCYQSYCALGDSEDSIYSTQRVEIEGIVYASQPNVVELWEVEVYCQVDNCSRAEIFQEIQDNVNAETDSLSVLFNQTSINEPGQLSCYECSCVDDPICPCNNILTLPTGETYCTIIRLYEGQNVYNIYEHIDRNSSLIYVREFPFMLVEESILYNEGTGRWNTRPTLIIYGCNTDYCNEPRLLPYLPIGFQMRLPETWLNSSVLGTGQAIRDCHECPNDTQCGTTDFLDASRCPVQACNTTCYVADTFDDPATGLLCYQSYCLSENADEDELSGHRVEIEGIIYGNLPNAKLELWAIEIYCRADDCSRPEIFTELQEQLTIDLGDLSAFFNMTTIPMITCYDCFCYDDPYCACTTFTEADARTSYCTIIRQNYDDPDFFIALEHINRNSTHVYVREFPYLVVQESILYNELTTQWDTRTNLIIYGCNTSYCNHPNFVPCLPKSFQMRLPDTWLNTNVLGTGQPVRDCHQCPDAPVCSLTDFIDDTACPIAPCNTTCLVSDLFDDPDRLEQCYQSFCAPPDSPFFEIDRARVEMEGILYLYPEGRPVELWEIDIFCRADNCSRPNIFNEIKDQFTTVVGDLSVFYQNTTTPGTTCIITTLSTSTTTGAGTTTSTTSGTGTTTTGTGTTTTGTGTTTSTTSGTGTTTSTTTGTGTTTSTTSGTGTTTTGTGTTTTGTGTTTSTTSGTGTTTTLTGTPTVSSSSTSQTSATTTTTSAGSSTYITDLILILFFLPISLINLH